MMFYCQFHIFKEDDDVLEFRYNQKHLYANLIIGVILFIYYLFASIDTVASLFVISIGVLFLLLGTAALFSNRKIIIDKRKKELLLIVGARKLYSKSRLIKFSQIKYIEINESPFGSGGVGSDGDRGSMKDTIYLNLKGENKVKLGISCSEEYSNIFTYKLSETIGCKVVCV